MSKILLIGVSIVSIGIAMFYINKLGVNRQFVIAAELDRKTEAKELLARISDINVIANDGWTALTSAARNNHLDMIKFLVNNGAEVDALDGGGNTALFWAAFYGHEKVFEYLLAENGNPFIKCSDCISPREIALTRKHEGIVKLIDGHSQRSKGSVQ